MASTVQVVLSGWACMLDIPLVANPQLTDEFYVQARRMINVAVKGCLDSDTIRAFMQAFQYAVPQDLAKIQQIERSNKTTLDGSRPMQGVYMNGYIFDDIIDRIQKEERGEPIDVDNNESPGDGGSSGPGKGPPWGNPPGSKGFQAAPEEDRSEFRTRSAGPQERSAATWRGSTDPSEGPSGGRGPRLPASWETILNTGLRRHNERYQQWRLSSRLEDEDLTRIRRPDRFDDDSVVHAIACLWEGLRHAGVTFGFGTANSFRFNRTPESMELEHTGVHVQRPLIMPLLFHTADDPEDNNDGLPSGKGKGKGNGNGKGRDVRPTFRKAMDLGHFVLVTAERNDRGQVQIIVRNSSLRHIGRAQSARTARDFVTYSGWMGVDGDGNQLPANPDFAPVAHPQVPAQRCGNTCGLHVVLNAWTYMLGIPIRTEREIMRDHTHFRFHGMALEIINLALAGFMDSSTIQALLIVWGYAVHQNVNNRTVHVRRANAARMDTMTLGTLVYEQRIMDRSQASGLATTEAHISQLIHMGFPRERVIQQLTLTGGNVDSATKQLTDQGTNTRTAPAVSYVLRDEDIQVLMTVGDFSRENVIRELPRARGDRNEAMVCLFDQMETVIPPTNSGDESPPPQSGTRAEPPGTEIDR